MAMHMDTDMSRTKVMLKADFSNEPTGNAKISGLRGPGETMWMYFKAALLSARWIGCTIGYMYDVEHTWMDRVDALTSPRVVNTSEFLGPFMKASGSVLRSMWLRSWMS